uniref:DUF1409 domain-containing protein n=1 Tax=Setaria viridis TaxID=4556 RepID=A0A4U6TK08_SETVI|nr:hypothetical protein SEVIR_8G144700v2 [Setaria viridis]
MATPPRCCPHNGVGTKGGEECTSQSAPETMTFLEADGDTDSTSELHIPPSNNNHPSIKDQLLALLQLLRQGTSLLLENVEPIQRLFRQIRTHLTNELMASLTPTGLIESHYSEVQRAKKSIVDRCQANAQLDTVKLKAKELMLELDRVNKAIAKAQGWLNDYPIAIQEKKKELAASINQVRHQHRQINDIPGSDEQDMQLIADVDQICLRVVEAIEKFL